MLSGFSWSEKRRAGHLHRPYDRDALSAPVAFQRETGDLPGAGRYFDRFPALEPPVAIGDTAHGTPSPASCAARIDRPFTMELVAVATTGAMPDF